MYRYRLKEVSAKRMYSMKTHTNDGPALFMLACIACICDVNITPRPFTKASQLVYLSIPSERR